MNVFSFGKRYVIELVLHLVLMKTCIYISL